MNELATVLLLLNCADVRLTTCHRCFRFLADGRSGAAPFVQVATANIHCLALDAAGRIFAWGCGSGGRCGVEVGIPAAFCRCQVSQVVHT